MIEVTGKEQQQAWAEGRLPAVEPVRPGLWSIPVPIPISPLRYVLVYAFELADGVAIVDAGWDTSEAWDALVAGLRVAGCAPSDVRAVLVTHIHPDHYGLAGRVREASGAWVGLHPADAALLDDRYRTPDELIDRMKWLLEECGVPDDVASDLSQASMPIRQFVAFSPPDVLLEEGDRPELGRWDLQAVWTPGHSPGHLCFDERRLRLLL
ncbi:MAG: MBL fold metallo-hydrolase, partial [Acidimicrobiia bacterium]